MTDAKILMYGISESSNPHYINKGPPAFMTLGVSLSSKLILNEIQIQIMTGTQYLLPTTSRSFPSLLKMGAPCTQNSLRLSSTLPSLPTIPTLVLIGFPVPIGPNESSSQMPKEEASATLKLQRPLFSKVKPSCLRSFLERSLKSKILLLWQF